MRAREELVARVTEVGESIAGSRQWQPRDPAPATELTLPQIRVLYMLASGPAKISEVSAALGMARPNASNMVERLVRKGLVERASDPNDRRAVLASLTDSGRGALEGMTHSNYEAFETIAEVLSIPELEIVVRALEVLEQGVKRLEAARKG